MAKFKLTDHEFERLGAEIAQAEQSTSGEIRLIIARRSSVVGHVFTVLFLQLLVLFMAFLNWKFALAHGLVVLAGVVCLLLFSYGLSRIPEVQRLLTNQADLNHQVWNRAVREFLEAGMEGTQARTGILIFVSLMERQTVVLADVGIASRLPQETWSGVVQTALSGARTGQWFDSLAAAVRECGQLLAEHYPPASENRNELSNRVLLKD